MRELKSKPGSYIWSFDAFLVLSPQHKRPMTRPLPWCSTHPTHPRAMTVSRSSTWRRFWKMSPPPRSAKGGWECMGMNESRLGLTANPKPWFGWTGTGNKSTSTNDIAKKGSIQRNRFNIYLNKHHPIHKSRGGDVPLLERHRRHRSPQGGPESDVPTSDDQGPREMFKYMLTAVLLGLGMFRKSKTGWPHHAPTQLASHSKSQERCGTTKLFVTSAISRKCTTRGVSLTFLQLTFIHPTWQLKFLYPKNPSGPSITFQSWPSLRILQPFQWPEYILQKRTKHIDILDSPLPTGSRDFSERRRIPPILGIFQGEPQLRLLQIDAFDGRQSARCRWGRVRTVRRCTTWSRLGCQCVSSSPKNHWTRLLLEGLGPEANLHRLEGPLESQNRARRTDDVGPPALDDDVADALPGHEVVGEPAWRLLDVMIVLCQRSRVKSCELDAKFFWPSNHYKLNTWPIDKGFLMNKLSNKTWPLNSQRTELTLLL